MLTLLTILYPLVVFYGLAEFSVRWVSLVLIALFLLRFTVMKQNKPDSANSPNMLSPFATKIISVVVLSSLLLSFIFELEIGLLFYPVVINAALALVFLYSLANPPPIIERLARLTQPNLPTHAVIYTRKVTKVWLAFFIFNGLTACYTALFTAIETWTLYNGLIAYILIGLLFSGEYIVRLRVQKRYDN